MTDDCIGASGNELMVLLDYEFKREELPKSAVAVYTHHRANQRESVAEQKCPRNMNAARDTAVIEHESVEYDLGYRS